MPICTVLYVTLKRFSQGNEAHIISHSLSSVDLGERRSETKLVANHHDAVLDKGVLWKRFFHCISNHILCATRK